MMSGVSKDEFPSVCVHLCEHYQDQLLSGDGDTHTKTKILPVFPVSMDAKTQVAMCDRIATRGNVLLNHTGVFEDMALATGTAALLRERGIWPSEDDDSTEHVLMCVFIDKYNTRISIVKVHEESIFSDKHQFVKGAGYLGFFQALASFAQFAAKTKLKDCVTEMTQQFSTWLKLHSSPGAGSEPLSLVLTPQDSAAGFVSVRIPIAKIEELFAKSILEPLNSQDSVKMLLEKSKVKSTDKIEYVLFGGLLHSLTPLVPFLEDALDVHGKILSPAIQQGTDLMMHGAEIKLRKVCASAKSVWEQTHAVKVSKVNEESLYRTNHLARDIAVKVVGDPLAQPQILIVRGGKLPVFAKKTLMASYFSVGNNTDYQIIFELSEMEAGILSNIAENLGWIKTPLEKDQAEKPKPREVELTVIVNERYNLTLQMNFTDPEHRLEQPASISLPLYHPARKGTSSFETEVALWKFSASNLKKSINATPVKVAAVTKQAEEARIFAEKREKYDKLLNEYQNGQDLLRQAADLLDSVTAILSQPTDPIFLESQILKTKLVEDMRKNEDNQKASEMEASLAQITELLTKIVDRVKELFAMVQNSQLTVTKEKAAELNRWEHDMGDDGMVPKNPLDSLEKRYAHLKRDLKKLKTGEYSSVNHEFSFDDFHFTQAFRMPGHDHIPRPGLN